MNWLPKKSHCKKHCRTQIQKKGTSDSKGNATMKYRFHFKLFARFLEGTDGEDLQAVVDDLVSLARMITRQQEEDSMNHSIGSINIRYINVLKHIIH
jgi:hypothetical protein